MSNFLNNAYSDLSNLININADEIRTTNLYVDGILILPSSTNFNNINCQTLTCQTDLSSNTLYATVSIQGVPVAKFAFLDATSSIQGQFNNITTNYVSNSSLTTTLSGYVNTTQGQVIYGEKTFVDWAHFGPVNCASIFSFNYIDFRSVTNPTTSFLINDNMIQIRVIIGLQSALDAKLSTTTAASTYATITSLSNYVLTSYLTSNYSTTTALISYLTSNYTTTTALNTLLSNYLTTSIASSTYLTQTNASSTYATISSLANYVLTSYLTSNYSTTTALISYLTSNYTTTTALNTLLSNYLTTSIASSTYLTQTNASSTYLTITDASNNYVKNTSLTTTLSGYVDRTTNQTIAGDKTLTGWSRISIIECGSIFNFNYIDFRYVTDASNNFRINDNMIKKSVIIGLTGDLSGINSSLSSLDGRATSLESRATADEVVIATNTTAIAGLVTTTVAHTTQIAGLSTAVGVLQGQITTAEGNITTLQAKTAYQNVVGTSTQFTNNLKMMNGLNYTILLNGTTGQSDFYGLMTVYNNLNVNGTAGNGSISTTTITASSITANTTLSSGGTLTVTSGSTLNGATIATGNLTITNGNLTISGVSLSNTFNNGCIFNELVTCNNNVSFAAPISVNNTLSISGQLNSTSYINVSGGNGIISTKLSSNNIQYKDQVTGVGNTANLFTEGGGITSFNNLTIGNLTTNTSVYGVSTFYGLTYFSAPSFNVTGWINQL